MNGKLRELRLQRGWTQEKLAEHLLVDNTTVSDWERGKSYPSRKSERKLVELFQKPIDYLLSDKAG